jgi:hypothetical protein
MPGGILKLTTLFYVNPCSHKMMHLHNNQFYNAFSCYRRPEVSRILDKVEDMKSLMNITWF